MIPISHESHYFVNTADNIAIKASFRGWLPDTFEKNRVPILSHCIGLSPVSACLALLFFPILKSYYCVLVSHLEFFLVQGRE